MKSYSNIVGRPPRVLIVDDNPKNRQLFEIMLSTEGLVIETASSGEQALAMVAQQAPDLILLDVMMPGLDGYQVVARIKRELSTQNIPVIILTALDDRESRLRGLKAGAEDFLSKPVDRAELRVRVRNLLNLKAYGDFRDKYGKMTDVTESERLYRGSFDHAPVGMAHIGIDGKWLRVNERLCEMLGYSRPDLQSALTSEQVGTEEVRGEAEALKQLAVRKLDRHLIPLKKYRRKDGSEMTARVHLSYQWDSEGEFHHFVAVIEEMTPTTTLPEPGVGRQDSSLGSERS